MPMPGRSGGWGGTDILMISALKNVLSSIKKKVVMKVFFLVIHLFSHSFCDKYVPVSKCWLAKMENNLN